MDLDVKLKRGVSGNLPADIDPGTILLETDTGAMYVDNKDSLEAEGVRIPVADPTKLPLDGTAAAASKLATARNLDGISWTGAADAIHYGTCSTAGATAAKTVTCAGFTIAKAGARIIVKFTQTNTATEGLTLNVNSTGAKSMYYRGSALDGSFLVASSVYEFVYDGAGWLLVGNLSESVSYDEATSDTAGLMSPDMFTKLYNIADGATKNDPYTSAGKAPTTNGTSGSSANYARGDHTHPVQTTVSGNAGTATKLANPRNINLAGALTAESAAFDGSADVSINVTAVAGAKVTGTVPAATKATQDGSGNTITSTYATIPVSHSATLSSSNWNSSTKKQTVTVNGVSATETAQEISWMPSTATKAVCDAAGVQCVAQAANSLTFQYTNAPTRNIVVYVVIKPVKYS